VSRGIVSDRRSPTIRRRRLGSELRRLRKKAGFTIESVAIALECSDSKVSRIETGQVSATPRDVRDMLELYGVSDPQQESLIAIAREARQKAWWQEYGNTPAVPLVGLEAAAASIHTYEGQLVPGLLQTKQYAEHVIRALLPHLATEEIDRGLEFRMRRQAVLTRKDPPVFWAVLDEAVIRRPVGGAIGMRKQLLYLADISSEPNITLQILPFAVGAHGGMNGQFTIFKFPDLEDPDVVYIEDTLSNHYFEDNQEVAQYCTMFDILCSQALKPADSVDLLSAAAKSPL
jgi:transcriptional regulator with XRE-family HTH domain